MLTFTELDKLRHDNRLTRRQVYQRAKLDKNVWSRLTANPTGCRVETLRKIKEAIDELIAEGAAA